MNPHTPTLEWSNHHEEALTVECTEPYCERAKGKPCVDRAGQELANQPAHLSRRQRAAAEAGHELDLTVEDHDGPDPPSATVLARRASKSRTAKPECNHCGGRLVWAVTVNGELMPVDAAPADDGNVLLTVEQGRTTAAVFGTRRHAAAVRAAGKQLHKHHRATCPFASSWPRKK